MAKKMVPEYLYLDWITNISGKTLQEASEYILSIEMVGFSDVRLYAAPYGYHGGFEGKIYGMREETDKEYNARLKREQKVRDVKDKVKSEKEERERKQYERLRRKYGNDDQH